MFLSIITAVVIMVIGNNLARAFGLVGAMSIIRFRTAIKETMDIVYIFFGLAVGMAAGVGYHKLAIAGTIMVSLFLIVFTKTNLFTLKGDRLLLQFAYHKPEKTDSNFLKVMNDLCSSYEMITIKTAAEDIREYSFYVNLKRKVFGDTLINQLSGIDGLKRINLFSDNENKI
jgi:uncharacterized membrane protein YhiD involved in acid resistance